MSDQTIGAVRVIGDLANPKHPADGLTASIAYGGGAFGTIPNPQSYADGGPVWRMTWGDPIGIRYSVASLLETFDYLLSSGINMTEATRRLRLMRNGYRDLAAAVASAAAEGE